MLIEKWKHTAFGSDFGGDFLNFLESLQKDKLLLHDVFKNSDLKQYFDKPELLNERNDNNVKLNKQGFDMFVHYEDAVIALSAVVAESELNGTANLTKAFGSKTISFEINKDELVMLKKALNDIHENAEKFVLFELCGEEEKEATLSDVQEMIESLEKCILKKHKQ